MENYIDLHMHSKYSDDGEFTPESLVKQCLEAGIKIMAIADHNSVQAIDEEIESCNKVGLRCIPAIEIDCTFKGVNLHVVGYGMDYKHEEIKILEENVLRQELACSSKKLELTNQLGFSLVKEDLEALSDTGVWTGEMFADALLSKEEYKDHELLKPYREGGNRSDNPPVNFYWDYYAQGKPCYTEIIFPTLDE
ncbi:MAG: PHP domain-containing protein, partial [Coprobacillaceae bacterium]